MSKGLDEFGAVEELYLMGATNKAIQRMTHLSKEDVERAVKHIQHNRDTLRGQNSILSPSTYSYIYGTRVPKEEEE